MVKKPIQNTISKGTCGQSPPKEKTEDKSTDNQHDDMTSPDGHETLKTKPIIISAIVFAVFEAVGLYFADIAEGLGGGYLALFFHWIALCCYIAGPFGVWHEMTESEHVNKKHKRIWGWYLILCTINAFVAYLVWRPLPPEPKPFPQLEFEITEALAPDDWAINLTNDFLKVTGDDHFKPLGVLFMPRETGQTDIMLNLWVRNISPTIDAEGTKVTISVDKNLQCRPFFPWELASSSVFISPSLDDWSYDLPNGGWILGGEWGEIPTIVVSQVSEPTTVFLTVRAKDSPPKTIGFKITFSSIIPQIIVNKPFLLYFATNLDVDTLTNVMVKLMKDGTVSLKE